MNVNTLIKQGILRKSTSVCAKTCGESCLRFVGESVVCSMEVPDKLLHRETAAVNGSRPTSDVELRFVDLWEQTERPCVSNAVPQYYVDALS